MTRHISIALILGLIASTLSAQPGRPRPEDLNEEEFVRMQAQDMASWLRLDQDTADKFIDTYSAFRMEINALALKSKPRKTTESEEEIDKAMLQNFEVSEKILEIRRRYYPVFKDFMKPSQIRQMYRFENEAGRRMHGPGAPGNPGGPDNPDRPDAPGKHDPDHRDNGQRPMGPPPQFGQAE